jgi:hypothetical protein
MISTPLMVVIMWKSSLEYIESDNTKFSYKNLLDFFKAKWYLVSEHATYYLLA